MPKQIKADLDKIVEAVYRRLDGNDLSSTMLDLAIRTALEQFVVESKEAQMDSLDKIIEDMEDNYTLQQSRALDKQYSLSVKLFHQGKADVLQHYLTRLKALRDLTDKKEEDESK
jgi:regulator of PEP synthase PpsR (kinase-PPPase family)